MAHHQVVFCYEYFTLRCSGGGGSPRQKGGVTVYTPDLHKHTGPAQSLRDTVAMSAYYKRLWQCFSEFHFRLYLSLPANLIL